MHTLIQQLELLVTRRGRPYWSDLRSVSNTTAVRAFILIPLLGYWIILNDQIVSRIANLSCHIVACPPLEPKLAPWRLFATYFGLCWIAAGSSIYQLCCPRIIKDYPDATAYGRSFVRDISGIEIDRVEEELRSEPVAAERTAQHRTFYERRRSNVSGLGFTKQDEQQVILDFWRNLLQEDFDLRNSRCYPGRLAVAIFYMIGFIVLMFPTLDVFLRVVGVLRRAL